MGEEIIALEKEYSASIYKSLPVVLEKGKGVWVFDIHGRRYLDMLSGYSAVSHGHRHPKIVRSLQRQLRRIAVISRAFYSDNLGQLMKRLCTLSGLEMGILMNSGAEAVETAIKAARRWGYQKKKIAEDAAEIIFCEHNFHGRTTTIISASSYPEYRKDFGPLTPGFKTIPFGDAKALREAITPNTCALIVEPIQGEAGIIVPPQGYLKHIASICRENNVLLILDEIQSGLGRTGKLFAFEHEEIKPDGLILGKALGGGLLPISVFLANRSTLETFEPGSHGSTFGGNPLAVAVAIKALDVLIEDKLIENSAHLGSYFLNALERYRGRSDVVDIRGRGLWVGLELNPRIISARKFCEKLFSLGILTKETHETIVRFSPPLTIRKKELDWALSKIDQAFQ